MTHDAALSHVRNCAQIALVGLERLVSLAPLDGRDASAMPPCASRRSWRKRKRRRRRILAARLAPAHVPIRLECLATFPPRAVNRILRPARGLSNILLSGRAPAARARPSIRALVSCFRRLSGPYTLAAGVLHSGVRLKICGFAACPSGRFAFPTSELPGRACGPLLTGLFTLYRERNSPHARHRYREILQHGQGLRLHQPEGGGKDVFVHATALEAAGIRSLNEGDRVSFVLEDDRRGRGKQAGQLQKA